MPRSNKRKNAFKPPPKDSTSQQIKTMETGNTIANMKSEERSKIITWAVFSATYHQINLSPGSPAPGLGDCAFEAAIQNVNERNFTKKKIPLPIKHLLSLTTGMVQWLARNAHSSNI